MERVPPQLDLKRLCDAADEIVKFYRGRIQRNWGIANDLDWELKELEHAIMIIPRRFWEGWTDAACERFADVSEKAGRVLSYWWEVRRHAEPNDRIVEQYGNVYAGVRKHIEFAQFEFENRIDDLKESADLLREKLTSPWPFHLLPDAKSQSLFRDESAYKHNVARLGDWFPVVAAICNAGGFLSHESTEKAYKTADFKGRYDNAFRKAVNTKINPELYPLGVELTATRGEGWKIELFSQTLP
jgi:hypothetical protein